MKAKLLFMSKIGTVFGALFLAATLWSFTGQNQESSEEGWVLLKTESGIKAYASELNCGGDALVAFRFVNTTSTRQVVDYTMSMPDDPTFPPISRQVIIPANESVSGNCDDLFQLALPDNDFKKSLKERVSLSLSINR